MNDVTRQVGRRARHRHDRLAGRVALQLAGGRRRLGLPSGAQDAVKDSIGTADAVAAQLPADQGSSLAHSAANAFTDALGLGLSAAAVAAFVAAAVVIRRLPARAAQEPQRGATPALAMQTGSAS